MNENDAPRIVYKLTREEPEKMPVSAKGLPRIARLMALAIRFEELLGQGTVKDYAAIARLGHVSRARITQIMNLLNLAPDIQEALLFLEAERTWRDRISERLCRVMIREPEWPRQRQMFTALLKQL